MAYITDATGQVYDPYNDTWYAPGAPEAPPGFWTDYQSGQAQAAATPVPETGLGLPAINTLPVEDQQAYWAAIVAAGTNTTGVPAGLNEQVRAMAELGDDMSQSPLGTVMLNEGTGSQEPYGALGRVQFGSAEMQEFAVHLGPPADVNADLDYEGGAGPLPI